MHKDTAPEAYMPHEKLKRAYDEFRRRVDLLKVSVAADAGQLDGLAKCLNDAQPAMHDEHCQKKLLLQLAHDSVIVRCIEARAPHYMLWLTSTIMRRHFALPPDVRIYYQNKAYYIGGCRPHTPARTPASAPAGSLTS